MSISPLLRVVQIAQIKCRKRNASLEDVHFQFSTVDNIPFPNLHKSTELRAGPPACMQEIASQRVHDNVNATAIRGLHDTREECGVARTENPIRIEAESADEKLLLGICADGCIDRGACE